MSIGPVQLLVIGFGRTEFDGTIRAELDRLREKDAIRLIDLLLVRKDADGNVERVEQSDLTTEEAQELGAVVGALIGFGAGGAEGAEAGAEIGAAKATESSILADDAWYVDDVLPNDSAAAIALIEHRWAIGLRDAILAKGGVHLADAWIHPLDLVAIGLLEAEEAKQHISS